MGITVMFSESDAFWELSFRSALWSRVFERFDGRPFMHDALASKGIYISNYVLVHKLSEGLEMGSRTTRKSGTRIDQMKM